MTDHAIAHVGAGGDFLAAIGCAAPVSLSLSGLGVVAVGFGSGRAFPDHRRPLGLSPGASIIAVQRSLIPTRKILSEGLKP
jgi:hypothetical protein